MITNQKAKQLFELKKQAKDDRYFLPNRHEILSIELATLDKRFQEELFTIDINRKYMSLNKITYQKRARETLVLRRLDFFASHQNPPLGHKPEGVERRLLELMEKYDSKRFSNETHLHFYIEGYGEKWAFPAAEFEIFNTEDIFSQAKEFCQYCNLAPTPTFFPKDLLCTV